MNERIKLLRQELGLNQTDFGERIKVKQTTIASYEAGRREPLETVVRSICREYNVNEIWLRTGEGEMFGEQSREDEIMSFVADVLNDDKSLKAKFLQALIEMRDEDLELILKLAKKLAED